MIIVLDYSALNKQVAEQLAALERSTFTYHPLALNFRNNGKIEKLTLLDLTTKGEHPILPGDTVADYLMAQGMPDTITTIDILIPDIQNKLPRFAELLTNHLKNRYNRDIQVRCFLNIQYDYTFIVQPITAGGNWTVYGINQKDLPKELKEVNVTNLASVSKKVKLWEGTNLDDCFVHANQVYIARKTELAQLASKTKFFNPPIAQKYKSDVKTPKRKSRENAGSDSNTRPKNHSSRTIYGLKPQ